MNKELAQIDFNALQGVASPNLPAGSELSDLFTGTYGIINLAFFFAGALLLIYLLWSGLSLMLSQGDPKAIGSGKAKVTNAAIGFLIIFAAYWIVQATAMFFGLPTILTVF